jgi:hypothetical protein
MVIVFTSSVVDRGFASSVVDRVHLECGRSWVRLECGRLWVRLECGRSWVCPNWVKPDYKIGICCFSVKHTALRSERKYLLAQSQDNVSDWDDISIRRLLFQ